MNFITVFPQMGLAYKQSKQKSKEKKEEVSVRNFQLLCGLDRHELVISSVVRSTMEVKIGTMVPMRLDLWE